MAVVTLENIFPVADIIAKTESWQKYFLKQLFCAVTARDKYGNSCYERTLPPYGGTWLYSLLTWSEFAMKILTAINNCSQNSSKSKI